MGEIPQKVSDRLVGVSGLWMGVLLGLNACVTLMI